MEKATPRQLWALYCITKKDYRGTDITKEEAFNIIKEAKMKEDLKMLKKGLKIIKKERAKKSLSDELKDYLMKNIDTLYNAFLNQIGYDSQFSLGGSKTYHFVGTGCGITYLTYRKNNKQADELDNAARTLRRNDICQAIVKKLPKKIYKELENKGCPAEAIWQQMQELQIEYFELVVEFAKSKGIKVNYRTHLD